MPKGPGCQVDAGIIDVNGKLTPIAKKRFIDQVIDELKFGTDNLPIPTMFPCGVKIDPVPFAELLDLHNEEKFPDFHKNILGSYEDIAVGLNLKSDLKLLPLCDPIALGVKLGIDISIDDFPGGFIPFLIPNPPALAVKLEIMPPPDLVAKFPDLPTIPPELPKFDIPPDIPVPLQFTLADIKIAFATGIPKFMLDLAGKMPNLALKIGDIPGLFGEICKAASEAELFGKIDPKSLTEIVAMKVLTAKTVEMTFIAAVGSTLGSAGGGIVGGLGAAAGYKERDPGQQATTNVREKIKEQAINLIGARWSAPGEVGERYVYNLLPVESADPKKMKIPDKRALGFDEAKRKLQNASSCGMTARVCLAAGGARFITSREVQNSTDEPLIPPLYYDFFNDQYEPGTAIDGIYKAAKAKGAIIPYTSGDLPPLKGGDIIIVAHNGNLATGHVIIVLEDYAVGSLELTTVEGGLNDTGNSNRPTRIDKKLYIPQQTTPKDSGRYSMSINANNELLIMGYKIWCLIDGEKLCTSPIGTQMNKPNNLGPRVAPIDGTGEPDPSVVTEE